MRFRGACYWLVPAHRDGPEPVDPDTAAHLTAGLDSNLHFVVRGTGDLAAIFLIFLASLLPLTLTAINAVESIPAVYINVGRNFGLSPARLVYQVLYPAVMPRLIIGLRITLGIAWLVVVAAEIIAVNSGLGFLIVDSRNAGNRYDLVVAGMVTIGVIGSLLDVGMRSLEGTRSLRWGYSEA